jgi:hypothetical protein
MRGMMKILASFIVLCVCACGALMLQRPQAQVREKAAPVAPPSAQANLVVALLGGFRGIVAEVIWFRADRLQVTGRYAELAQLATWLTFLEPRTPEVWSYAAWNLAYNISVMMPRAADRWRWVKAGLRLLRDDGLRLNPADPVLHREIAWLFLAKIGGALDDASPYYRQAWKEEVEAARRSGDWASLGLSPDRMARIDREYGKQDWTHPFASALYWGDLGLAHARQALQRRELQQLVMQTLMLQATADKTRAPRALAEMRAFAQAFPSPVMDDLIARFRARYGL